MPEVIDVCPLNQLAPGKVRIVRWDDVEIGVYNCGGELYAIEDRCSHDDGPLASEGDWDQAEGVAICPRHGATFDIRTGRALTLPAYEPVDTFPVRVLDGIVQVELE